MPGRKTVHERQNPADQRRTAMPDGLAVEATERRLLKRQHRRQDERPGPELDRLYARDQADVPAYRRVGGTLEEPKQRVYNRDYRSYEQAIERSLVADVPDPEAHRSPSNTTHSYKKYGKRTFSVQAE